MSDLIGHVGEYAQRSALLDSWETYRTTMQEYIEMAKARGMDYEEGSIFFRAALHTWELVNPWYLEAVQYWIAEAYDKVDEWRDK